MSVSLNIRPCRVCGTWVCSNCNWRREGANRHHYNPRCFKCGRGSGHYEDVRHTNQATREEHDELADSRGWN